MHVNTVVKFDQQRSLSRAMEDTILKKRFCGGKSKLSSKIKQTLLKNQET